VRQRLRDIGDARLALEGKFAPPPAPARSTWTRALPFAAALVLGGLGAAAYFGRPAAPMAAAPAQVTRFVITPPDTAPLSSLGGSDLAISPDGKRLAYLGQNAERNGVALYVREIDAIEPTLLAGTEVLNPGPNVHPFFAPDGKSIGFASPDGSVVRARVDGAPLFAMFQSELYFGATWLTDDMAVVATGAQLESVSTDGRGTREALTTEVPNVFVAAPSPLPDGKAVLFMSRDGMVPRVAVLDLETREQKILIEGGQKPVYASTGHIVFVRNAILMAVPFDAATRAVTGEAVELIRGLRFETNNAPDYALSASGTLAYVPGRDQRRWSGVPVWVDRSGNVVGRAIGEALEEPEDPRLAPDGARVVITVGGVGEGRLWLYDLRGRPPVPLIPGVRVGAAVWSPDGREIAFTDFNPTEWPIQIAPSNGSGPARRAASAIGVLQDWSAAGELLFVSGRDIRAAPAAGGEARDVVATPANEFDAALSPDGRWLAYVSDRTGRAEVWVQSYPDDAAVPVRISTDGGYEPRWSPDGKELFFLQSDSLYSVAVDVGQEYAFGVPVPLFSGNFYRAPSVESHSYDVARDGRFLMIQVDDAATADEPPASIVVVQNWFEELKRLVPVE
jgi:Tol biopolymer transport system component